MKSEWDTERAVDRLADEWEKHIETSFHAWGSEFDMLPSTDNLAQSIANAIVYDGLEENDVNDFIECEVMKYNNLEYFCVT